MVITNIKEYSIKTWMVPPRAKDLHICMRWFQQLGIRLWAYESEQASLCPLGAHSLVPHDKNVDGIPPAAWWIEALAFPQLWHRSQLRLGVDPWPGNFHKLWVWPKEENVAKEASIPLLPAENCQPVRMGSGIPVFPCWDLFRVGAPVPVAKSLARPRKYHLQGAMTACPGTEQWGETPKLQSRKRGNIRLEPSSQTMPLPGISQSWAKHRLPPVESILENFQNKASLNFHAGHPLAILAGCMYGEVMTDAQHHIMRMIFHLLWLMSPSREGHAGHFGGTYSCVGELCFDSQLPVFFISFLSWKHTRPEGHVLWLGSNFCGADAEGSSFYTGDP